MVDSIIFVGDLNIDLFSSGGSSSRYDNLLADFYLTQHVVGASHATDTSSTLIDHIFACSHISVLRSTQTCGLSDHKVQIVNLDYSFNKISPRVQHIHSLRNYHWDELLRIGLYSYHGILFS